MTVATENTLTTFLGNGTNRTFPFTFRVLSAGDVVVVVKSGETGEETYKTLTTDYTVSGVGSYNGGNVTFVTAPALDDTVTLRRTIGAFTQDVDLRNQGAFFAEVHEDAFDKLTMIAQTLKTDAARSVRLRVSDAGGDIDPELPEPVGGNVIGWNAEGTKLINFGSSVFGDGLPVLGGFYNAAGDLVTEREGAPVSGGTY